MKKRTTFFRGLAIAVIFVVLVLIVLVITLIAINYETIANTLGNIPGAIWDAIVTFPKDWLIAGAIGAALAFIACAIFWHWLHKSTKDE